jgi:hypothetical protein
MIEKAIFFMWVIWYFYKYIPNILSFNILSFNILSLNVVTRLINLYDIVTEWDFYSDDSSSNSESEDETDENENIDEKPKQELKYEDKYLADIRKLNKEWVFTDEENQELPNIIETIYKGYIDSMIEKSSHISKQILVLQKEIKEDTDSINFVEDVNEEGDELIDKNTLEERNEIRLSEIETLEKELTQIMNEMNNEESKTILKKQAEEQARQQLIDKRLNKLINCYIIEKTPNGNVIMIYQKDKESFKYYSDYNIPYRYLEVVGRKYVKLFNCRPIFIDMEEELRLFEEKWEKEQEVKRQKEEEDKRIAEEAAKNNKPIETKKNVFAKFKSYNKDAGGKINMAAPPKNSIPNKNVTETKEDEKILLKERANRYTYEGKFANFNFLQKIERKVFNKKLALSFADFKRIHQK